MYYRSKLHHYTNVGIKSHIILLNAFSARFVSDKIFNVAPPDHCQLFANVHKVDAIRKQLKRLISRL